MKIINDYIKRETEEREKGIVNEKKNWITFCSFYQIQTRTHIRSQKKRGRRSEWREFEVVWARLRMTNDKAEEESKNNNALLLCLWNNEILYIDSVGEFEGMRSLQFLHFFCVYLFGGSIIKFADFQLNFIIQFRNITQLHAY